MKRNIFTIINICILLISLFGVYQISNNTIHIFVGETLPEEMDYLIGQYEKYFDQNRTNRLNQIHVNTLVIFAHGTHNNWTSIILEQSEGNIYELTNLRAKHVIYISCSIGIIRDLDTNSNHYAYSLTDEFDRYEFQIYENSIEIVVIGWGQYFLDYLKEGYSYSTSEKLAREKIDKLH